MLADKTFRSTPIFRVNVIFVKSHSKMAPAIVVVFSRQSTLVFARKLFHFLEIFILAHSTICKRSSLTQVPLKNDFIVAHLKTFHNKIVMYSSKT